MDSWLDDRIAEVVGKAGAQATRRRPPKRRRTNYRDEPGFKLSGCAYDLSLEFPAVDVEHAKETFRTKVERGTAIRAHYELRRVFQELSDASKAQGQ